jgi:hypothetical protein
MSFCRCWAARNCINHPVQVRSRILDIEVFVLTGPALG